MLMSGSLFVWLHDGNPLGGFSRRDDDQAEPLQLGQEGRDVSFGYVAGDLELGDQDLDEPGERRTGLQHRPQSRSGGIQQEIRRGDEIEYDDLIIEMLSSQTIGPQRVCRFNRHRSDATFDPRLATE